MTGIVINGEEIPVSEAQELVRILCNDAEEMAGVFHGMNRSIKFRTNWPNEDDFAASEWKNFIEAVRAMYADRLGDPKTPPADARRMHLAIVLQDMIGKNAEKDTRLQLSPGTQQFEGDKVENRKILEKFGPKPNLRAALRNGVAKFARSIH